MLPDIAVGGHVLVARVRQPGITPKLLNIWTILWRVVLKTGGHTYDVEEIVMERAGEMHIARVRPCADASLNLIAELKKLFNDLINSQSEVDMKRLEAVDLTTGSEEYVMEVKWVGLDEEQTTWEPVSTIYYADAQKYLVACGRWG